MDNGGEDARAGSGVWFADGDARNMAVRLPAHVEQSNNTGEAVAVLAVAAAVPAATDLDIFSDSSLVIDGMTKNLRSWENRGWIGVANRQVMRATVAQLRNRTGKTTFHKVKGHSGDAGNDGAGELAGLGARKEVSDDVNLDGLLKFKVSGARLSRMTQALLYAGLLELKPLPYRRGTIVNLDMVRFAVESVNEEKPTDRRIWTSLRSRGFSRNVRAFLWKAMHNAFRCGRYWDNIPNYEHRAVCQACGMVESLEHVLAECEMSARATIIAMCKKLWMRTGLPWPEPTFGAMLGCGLARFVDAEGKTLSGASRLYRILMFLIWKTRSRCAWMIDKDADPDRALTEVEIQRTWLYVINERLKLDCLMTDRMRYGRKALRSSQVKLTWEPTLDGRVAEDTNWYRNTGVLVGIGVERPPGRNR